MTDNIAKQADSPSTGTLATAKTGLIVPSRSRSKTMRLDILPNSDMSLSAKMPASYAKFADATGLALTNEILRHLYNNAYYAMVITNLRGDILSGNMRATEYLVGEAESVIGLNMLNIISGADATLLERLHMNLARERFVRIHAWCQRTSGQFFPAEIAVHLIIGIPIPYLCFFLHDITWRKEAEDRLQMADVAMRTTAAGIAVIDMEEHLVFANPAMNRLFGCQEGMSLIGRSLAELFSDSKIPGFLMQAVSTDHAWYGQVECVRQDGGRLMAACEAAANFNSDGDLSGAALCLHDLTDHLRAAEAEQIVERNRVMMASIGSVCHHLGQPSTVLLNCMELLLRLKDEERERRKELLELSLSAAESLRELLHELNSLRTYRSEAYLANSQPHGDQIISINRPPASGKLADVDVIDD